jgi:hypothetical protein
MRYTISARAKPDGVAVLPFLAKHFPRIPVIEIDSVFGFVERSTLYGGRVFAAPELTPHDVSQLYYAGIGVRLPLTNHYVELGEYENNQPLLETYHREGNAVICTNDELARWIRRDFPKYRIEASVIKNLKTPARIAAALELYDTAVLPMELNDELDLLAGLADKPRITLFANAGCALTCPSRICYASVSRLNKGQGGEFKCSQPLKERELRGMVDFDLERYVAMGFDRFKVLRARPGGLTGH